MVVVLRRSTWMHQTGAHAPSIGQYHIHFVHCCKRCVSTAVRCFVCNATILSCFDEKEQASLRCRRSESVRFELRQLSLQQHSSTQCINQASTVLLHVHSYRVADAFVHSSACAALCACHSICLTPKHCSFAVTWHRIVTRFLAGIERSTGRAYWA